MAQEWMWIALTAPAGWLAAGLVSLAYPGLRSRPSLILASAAGVAALVTAVLMAIGLLVGGAGTTPVIGWNAIGISVRIDALSATLLALIAALGWFVVDFSRGYLDGDERQGSFMGGLCFTLAGVSLLVLSGNLWHLFAAWVATSAGLHRLLVFYPHRPGALLSAHKKFWFARTGDLFLATACLLLAHGLGTADLHEISDRLAHLSGATPPLWWTLAGVLLVGAACLKSAQFPTHGWLAELMETPTPVSALLHAGILNGGVFLIARLSDVVHGNPWAGTLLILVGGFTSLFGGAVMVTQSCVKTQLAYSSMAHMGFMLLQCGLGAYPLAIAHMVAHSFYKAHAFLASASAVEMARASDKPGYLAMPGASGIAARLVVALAIYVGVGVLIGFPLVASPAVLWLGAVYVLGITSLIAFEGRETGLGSALLGKSALVAAATTASFFALEMLAHRTIGTVTPGAKPWSWAEAAAAAMVMAAYALVAVAQWRLSRRPLGSAWASAYVWLKNGLYVNAWINRQIGLPRLEMRAGWASRKATI